MKIGILLRHYEQHPGGVMNYTLNLLDHLLRLGKDHEFVLIYKNPALIGTYRHYSNVREIAYRAPSILLWDQLVVPWIEHREKFDVLFNPKWSMPLLVNSPQVFVCHGLDWYAMPWGSPPLYRLTHKYLIPSIADNASSIICVSRSTANDAKRFLNVPEEKLRVIYHGIGESFLEPVSREFSESIRKKYDLPDRYFLYVGQVYPAKNFDRLIQAYERVRDETGVHLVVAGQHTFMCEDQMVLPESLGISDSVHFIGWIEHDELPALYENAVALALPSLYEACPSPILEAMAMGCPVVTGDRTGMSEIAGGAACEVDPEDVDAIADGLRQVATDAKLRGRLREAGLQWVQGFSWEKCAAETLEAIVDTYRRERGAVQSPRPETNGRAIRDHQ